MVLVRRYVAPQATSRDEIVVRSTVSPDLEEQFWSVQHAVWSIYSTGNRVRILSERPEKLQRPSWRVRYLTHRTEQQSSRHFRQIADWTLDYYGTDRVDVMDKLDRFERSIMQGGSSHRLVRLIPAWRYLWQFPQITATPVTDVAGTLIAGDTYHVRVSGVDVCGNESAASVEQLVLLPVGTDAINIRIPRIPYSQPLFKNYHVYVDGHREAILPSVEPQGLLYPQVVITGLLGSGAAPLNPSDTVRVRWAFLRVTGFASGIREDDVDNGVFTGNVHLQTTMEAEHDRVQAPAIQHVEALASIPDDSFTITVGA